MSNTTEGKRLYSVTSAAQALDISRSKLFNMIRAGQIKTVRVGADPRIPASEVERIASEGAPAPRGNGVPK